MISRASCLSLGNAAATVSLLGSSFELCARAAVGRSRVVAAPARTPRRVDKRERMACRPFCSLNSIKRRWLAARDWNLSRRRRIEVRLRAFAITERGRRHVYSEATSERCAKADCIRAYSQGYTGLGTI